MTLGCLPYVTWTLLSRVSSLDILSGGGELDLKEKAPGLSPVLHSRTLRSNELFHLSLYHSQTTRKKNSTHSPGSSGVLRKMIKNERNEHVTTNRGGWQDGTDKMEED